MQGPKKRSKKGWGSGVLFLCSLSLMGVGFSSWVYGETANAETNFQIGVGNVVDMKDYLSVEEISHFDVCPTGILANETISFQGQIAITMSVSLKHGLLPQRPDLTDALRVNIDIANEGTFNFFSPFYLGSSTPSAQFSFYAPGETPVYSTVNASIEGDVVHAELLYANVALQEMEKAMFTIIYSFDFSTYKNEFQTKVYDRLGENPLAFRLFVEVK